MKKDAVWAERSGGSKFHAYMRGWRDGAGGRGVRGPLSEHYLSGYRDGQAQGRKAAERAGKKYGYAPQVLRLCAERGEIVIPANTLVAGKVYRIRGTLKT